MYYDTVEEKTLELLKSIQAIPELSELRLVGGTALALQIGHRISIDLDFFGKWNINGSLEPVLSSCGDVVVDNIQRKMQFFTISGIKTDFVEFDYPWISPPVVALRQISLNSTTLGFLRQLWQMASPLPALKISEQ